MARIRPEIETGRQAYDGKHLIVVGTQCIEAGANFDFNAMVTECATLDALRQRFGRVDRLGAYGRSESVIFFDKSAKEENIVYGEALTTTAKWLKARKRLDFGVLALAAPPDVPGLLSPKKSAPVLMPAYLDLWMQTSPRPAVLPDVSLWLHGEQSGAADVRIVWRADIEEEDLRLAFADKDAEERLAAVVSSIPPSSLEAISLPYRAAWRWLQGVPPGDIADAEGAREEIEEEHKRALVIRWDGDATEVIAAGDVKPGDTIIVPCSRGGIRDCASTRRPKRRFEIFAEQSSFFARGVPAMRLHPEVLKGLGLPEDLDELEEVRTALELRAEEPDTPLWKKTWLDALARSKPRFNVVSADESKEWGVLRGKRLPAKQLVHLREAESAEDGSS